MRTSRGKAWTMYCGDSLLCLDAITRDHQIHSVIGDPPYSSGGAFRGDTNKGSVGKYLKSEFAEFHGDTRDQRSVTIWLSMIVARLRSLTAAGATFGLFTDWRQIAAVVDALQVGGLVYRGVMAWVKPSCRPQPARPANACEFIVWGSNGALPVSRDALGFLGALNCLAPSERVHPTEKPIEVMRWVVEVCVRGGTVLDPWAGSATTGVAAIRSGRQFVGVELSEEYYSLACDRLSAEESGQSIQSARAGQRPLFGGAK